MPPRIPPLCGDRTDPRWSVMIPTYNRADLLVATLESVLAEDQGPEVMQIEVVDDASEGDDVAAVVGSVGRGRVGFHRQPSNVGIARNLTTCVERSLGTLVHVLHGDDLVYPGFYRAVEDLLAAHPEAGAAIVGDEDIDEGGARIGRGPTLQPHAGLLGGDRRALWEWNPLRAPSIVVRRSVYERVGGFRPDLRFCADWDQWKRVAADGPIAYDPTVRVGYRVHGRSDTSLLGHSLPQLREVVASVRLGHRYLPDRPTRAWTALVYHRTRVWAWAALRRSWPDLGARDRLGYAGVVLESVARQQLDRVTSRLTW